jgi:hypothetical protein
MGKGRVIVLAGVVAALLATGAAQADRKPTPKERKAVAKILQIPETCATIRVSTVPDERKFAKGGYRFKSPDKCDKYAADGVVIVKKTKRGWRFVDAGSSFLCKDLYEKVPQSVVEDLDIFCG